MRDREGAENQLTRRDFLRKAAVGAAATVGAASGLGLRLPAGSAEASAAAAGMVQRTLGRTKLKVSQLGMGLIKTDDPALLRRGLDLGINYFDTAACYRNGNSEEVLGRALQGRRQDAVVATKWHTNGRTSAKELLASLDGSLRRLQMECVDLIQIHGAGGDEQVNSDELWDAFTRARQAGKARFNGLSTHGDEVAVVRAAIKSGRYDAVLVAHNAMTADRICPVLKECRDNGVGVVIMKALGPAHEGKGTEALAGLRGNPYQKSIQWVLKDSNVSTVIVDMPTFDELQEDFAAAVEPMTLGEQHEFERVVAQISPGACHLCGACTGQCPAGVQVADIMRHMLYHDGYGDRGRAASFYRSLPAAASASRCLECQACQVVCPWGVAVRSRLERAHAVLA